MTEAIAAFDDGPEKAGPGQIFTIERIARGSGKGAARRHRNIGEHPLVLARGRDKISAEEYSAGAIYRALCEKLARSGKDSTIVAIPGGSGATPWTQEQVDAIRSLQKIDAMIGQQNAMILRKFCGDGASAAESVQRFVPCHPNGVMWRLREALDSVACVLRKLKIRVGIVDDPLAGKR